MRTLALAVVVSVAILGCSQEPPSVYLLEVDLPQLHRCDGYERSFSSASRPADCAAPPCGWYDVLVVSEPSGSGGFDLYATPVAAYGPNIPPPAPPAVDRPYDRTPQDHLIRPRTKISKNVVASELERTLLPSISAAGPTELGVDQKCVMLDPSQRMSFGDVVRMHKALTHLGVRRTNLAAREAID